MKSIEKNKNENNATKRILNPTVLGEWYMNGWMDGWYDYGKMMIKLFTWNKFFTEWNK